MKKYYPFLLFLIILCFSCIGLASELNEYYINEINLKISFPDEYVIITRNNMDDMKDLLLNRFGTTKETQLKTMKEQNSYLKAVGTGSRITIEVTSRTNINPSSDQDYNQISDMLLMEIGTNFYFNDSVNHTEKIEIYKVNGLKWIVPYYSTSAEESLVKYIGKDSMYTSSAITIEDGNLYNIIFVDTISTNLEEYESFVEMILDSITILS